MNKSKLIKLFFLTVFVIAGFIYFNSASASTLNIVGRCVDDELRVMKNGELIYDGSGIAKCATRRVETEADCDDKIEIQLKDNKKKEVGFRKIILSYEGWTEEYNRWYYLGNLVTGKKRSNYPSIKYYNTEVSGTLRELGLCPTKSSLKVSCHASPSSIKAGQSSTFVSSVSGGTGSYNYSWSGACQSISPNCTKAFYNSGRYSSTVKVVSGDQTEYATCSISVEESSKPDYFACYSNDLYWFDYQGNRKNMYQDCGEDSWTNNFRCSGDIVQREKTERGCENNNCYEKFQWHNYENCAAQGNTCQNGACVRENDLHVTCEAHPDPAETGEQVTFSANASGGDSYYYSYSWSGDCYNRYSSSCKEKFYSPGTYSATVTVRSGSEQRTATCRVRIEEEEEEEYLACYNDDVYWFNQYNDRLRKYKDCGSDYCESQGKNYCYDGDVYERSTCYEKGCSSGACYTHSYTERELVERCGSGETCSNGRCVSECECSSGPCCDGCYYKSSDTVCNIETQNQNGCPWGSGCGADVGERTKSRFQYCSGESSQCNGNWGNWGNWGSWQVSDYCNYAETCFAGSPVCQYNSACVTPQQTYYQNYTKACYNNDVYWFDSNGVRQGRYRDCSGDNECTLDRCENGICVNDLKCDGSSCLAGSGDYCEHCDHCGDGSCNCGENNCSCYEDCLGMVFSILAKSQGEQDRWEESIEAKPGEEIYFLINVTNSGPEDWDEVVVNVDLPSEISYDNELAIEGSLLSGSIKDGINIGFLPANTTRTISFQGKVSQKIDTSQEVEVMGEVRVNNSSASDYAKVDILATGRPSAAAGLIFSVDLFKKWYFWFLILPVALVILFLVSRRVFAPSRN